jgi:hypothetical protein
VSSEVLKAETVESGVLWDVAPGIVLEIAGVTEGMIPPLLRQISVKTTAVRPFETVYKIIRHHIKGCCTL